MRTFAHIDFRVYFYAILVSMNSMDTESSTTGVHGIVSNLKSWLEQHDHDQSKVLMLCGCAGKGFPTVPNPLENIL